MIDGCVSDNAYESMSTRSSLKYQIIFLQSTHSPIRTLTRFFLFVFHEGRFFEALCGVHFPVLLLTVFGTISWCCFANAAASFAFKSELSRQRKFALRATQFLALTLYGITVLTFLIVIRLFTPQLQHILMVGEES